MDSENGQTPALGLALSGGTAKVIAHIGVLRALEEAELRPDVMVGTSGGALIATAYASGVGIDQLTDMADEVNWRRLAAVRIPRLGLLSSQRIEDFVREIMGDRRFEELQIPTRVVTTNLLTGEKTVFASGPVAPVVRASCSIPQIFGPVEIDGGLYTDGGVIEYLPLQTLREMHPRVCVGVHLGAYLDFSAPPRHLLGMIVRVIGLVAAHNARASAPLADVLIEPDLRAFNGFDLTRAAEMIDVGYQATRLAVPRIRELLDEQDSLWTRLRRRLSGRATPLSATR